MENSVLKKQSGYMPCKERLNMNLSQNDREALIYAKRLLEHPGLAVTLVNLVGVPLEKGLQYLPTEWTGTVQKVSKKALGAALNVAVSTLNRKPQTRSADMLHKAAAATSGCVGGFFGLPALAIELPVSTTIMLRSIADIARSQGEDLERIETRLACLEVFALGGSSKDDDSAETGYYAVRTALSGAVSEAAAYVAEKGIAESGAPVLVRLIAEISSYFGIAVSEKIAASAVPVIGAAGSATINMIFINHFQNMARGHFIVRRLERRYSTETVKAEYDRIR